MNRATTAKLGLVLLLLAAAVVLFIKLSPAREGHDEKAYFYDLSEQKLFVAPRSSIPPIHGIKHTQEVGVRAVVIATNGNSNDRASCKIAYLEKYAPELKKVMEAVQAGQRAQVPEHRIRQSLIFVKRLADAQWYPVNSPEGEKIMNEWNVPDAQGNLPVVCSP